MVVVHWLGIIINGLSLALAFLTTLLYLQDSRSWYVQILTIYTLFFYTGS